MTTTSYEREFKMHRWANALIVGYSRCIGCIEYGEKSPTGSGQLYCSDCIDYNDPLCGTRMYCSTCGAQADLCRCCEGVPFYEDDVEFFVVTVATIATWWRKWRKTPTDAIVATDGVVPTETLGLMLLMELW